ncbi:thioredoxin-like domain-containing protein [Sarocladium implicatum]|nr:thioredoxin-like domain-containing protein [Sarocladium implicatum]
MGSLAQRVVLLSGILAALTTGAARAWEFEGEQALNDALARGSPVLVALIADSADQKSRDLEVEWSDVVPKDERVGKLVHRCTSESELCRGVEDIQFPRVAFVAGRDEVSFYRGPRSATEINLFAQRMQQPVVSRVERSQDGEFWEIYDGACLCTASPDGHGDFVAAFEDVARQYHSEYTFGLKSLSQEPASGPLVECRNQQGSKKKTYTQDGRGIEAFVLDALRPTIVHLTPYNHQRLLNRQWPMVYIFGNSPSQRASLRRDLDGFASSWPDLTTVLVDPLDFPDLPAKLGLESKGKQVRYPAGAVHQLTTGKIWPYPPGKALDKGSLQKWGMDVWQGRIAPWNDKGGQKSKGQQAKKSGNVKSHRQIKLPNVPGLEELRRKLEARDEL